MLRTRAAFFTLSILSLLFSPMRRAHADDAPTLAAIEAAVAAHKATPAAIHLWIGLLSSESSSIPVKERTAWALGLLGKNNTRTVPALLKAAEHKGLLVRSAAVNSLVRLRAKAALPTLEKIAKTDPILNVRREATLGLGLLASDPAIPALVDLSLDATPEVRGASALAMSALQSKKNSFIDALQSMLTDDNPYVQERVKDALVMAQKKNVDTRALLASSEQDVRLFAAFYFLRYGASADKTAVQVAYDGESDDDVRQMLADANIAIKKRAAVAKKKISARSSSKTTKKKKAGTKKVITSAPK
jgi:HEAT repeat protein